jgi:hypothetical protein
MNPYITNGYGIGDFIGIPALGKEDPRIAGGVETTSRGSG